MVELLMSNRFFRPIIIDTDSTETVFKEQLVFLLPYIID